MTQQQQGLQQQDTPQTGAPRAVSFGDRVAASHNGLTYAERQQQRLAQQAQQQAQL